MYKLVFWFPCVLLGSKTIQQLQYRHSSGTKKISKLLRGEPGDYKVHTYNVQLQNHTFKNLHLAGTLQNTLSHIAKSSLYEYA